MNTTTSSARPRIGAAQWDALRIAFHRSPLIDIPLVQLAQNVDGCRWSPEDSDEKPSAYIDLTHAEAVARLRALRAPAAAMDDLADILRGTLAYDASFGEMMTVAGRAEAASDPVARNMQRLGIPETFPVEFCNLKPATLDLCRRENILVLSDFISFARSVSRQVILASEFRDLLNSLTHVDESTLSRLLPFRPRSSGLHLVESLAHLVRHLDDETRLNIAHDPARYLDPAAKLRMKKLGQYFQDEALSMRQALAAGTPLSRLVAPLDEITLEPAAAALLGIVLQPPAEEPAPAPRKRGFFARLFGRA